MKNVNIKNSNLIPVDSILYKINCILRFKYGLSHLKQYHTKKSLIESIVNSVDPKTFRKILIDIFTIIDDDTHILQDYSRMSMVAHIDNQYLQNYRTDRIIMPCYISHLKYNDLYINSMYSRIKYRKSLDGKFYLDDIYYIVYIKKEHILGFIYLLFYDQINVHRHDYMFEVHFDEDEIKKNVPSNVAKEVYQKWDSYKHISIKGLMNSLEYDEKDENEVFEKLYNNLCRTT